MSNKPHLRPGHPIHGNQRRFLRSAKARRRVQIQMNTIFNQMRKQQIAVKGLDKFIEVVDTPQPSEATKAWAESNDVILSPGDVLTINELEAANGSS